MSDLITHSRTYVFILSAGHSGSTLLDLLLGSHSRITSLGEITHFPKNYALNTLCGCGVAIRECRFWDKVLDEVELRIGCNVRADPYSLFLGFIRARNVIDHAHQTPLALARRAAIVGYTYALRRMGLPVPRMPFHDLPAMAKNKAQFYEVVGDVSGTRVLVDSSKFYLDAVELYRRFPDQTRILFLTREGRAVYHSGLQRGVRRDKIIRTWRKTYERALPLLEKHISADARLNVRYEDLSQEPEDTLKTICQFVGVDYESRMLNFGDHTHHITNGNNMRFTPDQTIRFDDAWKTKLSADALDYFEAHGGDLNRRLGYT